MSDSILMEFLLCFELCKYNMFLDISAFNCFV